MSEELLEIFRRSLDQTVRDEQNRAANLKAETRQIPISHLNCKCGKSIKDKLVKGLILSSSISFECFMTTFYEGLPVSHEKITMVRKTADVQKKHKELVFLENLVEENPALTLHHIIDGLEKAHLYRVIASLEMRCVLDLLEHSKGHTGYSCCSTTSRVGMGTSVFGNNLPPLPRLHNPKSHEPSATPVKACRGTILLTFVEDGRCHAEKVKEVLKQPCGKSGLPYNVYFLSDFSKLIAEDLHQTIVWLLSEVDFVVPIISQKYIQMMINDKVIGSSSDLNEKYAPLVARLLVADWQSSFKNTKTRCYRPSNVDWPKNNMIFYPPFYTAVDEPSDLPSILMKSSYR